MHYYIFPFYTLIISRLGESLVFLPLLLCHDPLAEHLYFFSFTSSLSSLSYISIDFR